MDEDGVQGRPEQGLGGLGGGLDEIAQDPVVTDFQGHAALGGQLRLQGQDDPPAVIAKPARLVQLRPDPGGDEAPVAGLQGQVRPEARRQAGLQVGQPGIPRQVEGGEAPGQLRRRRRLEGPRPGAEEVHEARAACEPVAQGSEVPGTAPPEGQARQGAGHVALSL